MKEIVANEIAKRVKNGDVLGVGTGTTVDAALEAIGRRVAHEGLLVTVVPTSYQSAWRCQELGLTVMYGGYRGYLSWGFDGADQVTNERWAIKGKGGASYRHRTALCLETENFPDAPNHADFPSPVLRPGSSYKHRMVYRFLLSK